MSTRISVIDVETPNMLNDKICSIGITQIVDGKIVDSSNYYINPECDFSLRNINLHHIVPSDVKNSPSFPETWPKIKQFFANSIIAAHNANFDLCVLRKVFSFYGIFCQNLHYIDTLALSRDLMPELSDYKLDTICQHQGISLDHHNSGSDSMATANIIVNALNDGVQIERYINTFDLSLPVSHCQNQLHNHMSEATEMLLELKSLLEGITEDGIIDSEEFAALDEWIHDHPNLSGQYPYDALFNSITVILEDGIVEEAELQLLLEKCNQLLDPVKSTCEKGMIDVNGKKIVLSGEFICGSKSEVSEKLISLGAVIQNGVTRKTDIVLVGGQGSDAWVAGNYGTKVKKAMELQAKGISIAIIREEEIF